MLLKMVSRPEFNKLKACCVTLKLAAQKEKQTNAIAFVLGVLAFGAWLLLGWFFRT